MTEEGAHQPAVAEPWPGWRVLWREARPASRVAFAAVALLFTQRALYRDPHPDRLGFQRMGSAVLAGGWDEDPQINTYPPPFSVAMTPVSWLAGRVGDYPVRVLWGLAQLAALVVLTRASVIALRLAPSLGLVAATWIASWRFVVGDLNSQNLTLFLEALVAVGVLQASRAPPERGGALLGLGAAIKVWPGLAAVGWSVGRRAARGRMLIGLLLGVGLTAFTTIVLLGSERTEHGLEMWLTKVALHFGGPELQNQAWKGLLLRLLGPEQEVAAHGFALAIGLILLGGLLLYLARHPSRSTRVSALDASLVVVVGLPCLPTAWYFYQVSLIPLLLAVIASAREPALPRSRSTRVLLALGLGLAAVLDPDLVGARVWSVAATFGNTLFGSLAIATAALGVRAAWCRADAGTA